MTEPVTETFMENKIFYSMYNPPDGLSVREDGMKLVLRDGRGTSLAESAVMPSFRIVKQGKERNGCYAVVKFDNPSVNLEKAYKGKLKLTEPVNVSFTGNKIHYSMLNLPDDVFVSKEGDKLVFSARLERSADLPPFTIVDQGKEGDGYYVDVKFTDHKVNLKNAYEGKK